MRIFIPQLPEVENIEDLRRSVYEGFKKIVDQLQGVSDSVPAKATTTTVATKKGITTSSLSGGVGVTGASTINNATLGTPTYVNNGDGTVSVTLPWTAPAVPGEFIGIHVYVEDPDQSSGNKGTNLTGSTTFGGNPDMSGTWQPADLGKFTDSPAVFNLSQQINSRTIRIYGVSYSTSIENDLVRYGATGASPSTTLLIDPVGVANGEEYARLVTNVGKIDYGSGVTGIRFISDYTAGQRWSEGVTWSWPTAPPSPTQGQIDTVRLIHRYQMLFQDGSAMPDTLWADVGHPFTKNEDVKGWPLIPYHYKFTTYFVSGSGGNFNSIVDGVTPSVSYEFDWPLSANTYASNVTGASATVTTPTSSDGTNMKQITVTFTPPTENTWGGVILRVYDGSTLMVQPVKGISSPISILVPNPSSSKTYTWKLVSFDVNNKINAEDGSTPQGNVAVGSASGTLDGAKLVVSSVSTVSLDATKIMVGGGGSKPGYFEVYNAAGSAIGFIGTQSGNDGAWFKTISIGGTSYTNGLIKMDSSGNVSIDVPNGTQHLVIAQSILDPSANQLGIRIANGASPCAGSNTAWYVGSGVSIFGPRLVTNYSDYRDYTYGVMAVDTNGGTLRLYGSSHTGTSTNYISFTGSNGQVRADGGFYIGTGSLNSATAVIDSNQNGKFLSLYINGVQRIDSSANSGFLTVAWGSGGSSSLDSSGNVSLGSGKVLKVNSIQVVGAQQADIGAPSFATLSDAETYCGQLRTVLRNHGLMA